MAVVGAVAGGVAGQIAKHAVRVFRAEGVAVAKALGDRTSHRTIRQNVSVARAWNYSTNLGVSGMSGLGLAMYNHFRPMSSGHTGGGRSGIGGRQFL